MKRLQNKTNVQAPDSDYPYGAIKNNTGSNNGTPVNVDTYGDFHQFFEKVFAESGLTANGLPDNATNGFQLFQAFINSGNKSFTKDIITSLIGSYIHDDVIILWGVNISTVIIPGTITHNEGAIFYNGIIYKVPAGAPVTISGDTLVFKINTSVQPYTIYLDGDSSGSGIANYNASSVKRIGTGTIQKSNVSVKKIVVPIGVWDMDTTGTKDVDISSYISFPSSFKIVNINATIINDDETEARPIGFAAGLSPSGSLYLGSDSIVHLSRNSPGTFDDADYSTASNRGYVDVEYLD